MSRWYFWVLAPMFLGAAIGLPIWTEPPTLFGEIVVYIISFVLVCATIGLADPQRLGWAFKPVALVILLGYSGYVGSEFLQWLNGEPFGLGARRSESTLFNAICGFIVFGVPSLTYLIKSFSGGTVDPLSSPSSYHSQDRE